MFIPEYTITPEILKNISAIEYNRALIDNTVLLQNFEQRIEKEAKIAEIRGFFNVLGINISREIIKKHVDGINSSNKLLNNMLEAYRYITEISLNQEVDDTNLIQLHKIVTAAEISDIKRGKFRAHKIQDKTDPEEILAETVELFDWFNSLDAMESNPIITSGVLKARLEHIQPFDVYNSVVADFLVNASLQSKSYTFSKYLSLSSYYSSNKRYYEEYIYSDGTSDSDLTAWLEYFSEGINTQTANVSEKVKLYAKDSKLAKATGRIQLTKRQERIVEYLQDYGILQNKHFSVLFPKLSEDSILRDLKKLLSEGIVVKRGSTKSSRYELR